MEKRRLVPAAVLLSLSMPGLGHLYCGRPLLAAGFWLLSFLGWGIFLLGFGAGVLSLATAFGAVLAVWSAVWISACLHAGFCARKAGPGYRMRSYNLWYFYLLLWILGAALPNFAVWSHTRARVLTTIPMLSDGMLPTLLPGDLVLVDRRPAARQGIERGAVMAVRDPADGQTVRILRVVGLPGDTVELSAQGLVLNGEVLPWRDDGEESATRKSPKGAWTEGRVVRVSERLGQGEHRLYLNPDRQERRTGRMEAGPGTVLLLGDNRIDAVDSLVFGPVPREFLLGRAIMVRRSRDPRTGGFRLGRQNLEIR